MDIDMLAARAREELSGIVRAMATPSTMQAAEIDRLAPHMLKAMLAHELVAGHAAMMTLAAKAQGFLDRISADGEDVTQDRASREGVRLSLAAARLQDRYRIGLLSLARLKGWDGFRPKTQSPDLPDPDDGGPGTTASEVEQALAEFEAFKRGMNRGHGSDGSGLDKPPSAAGLRRGRLRHGNPSGDFLAAPRCGARTRAGCPCRQPAMPNGRCRFHGGRSTGARTAEGHARCRTASLRHGGRTAEIIALSAAAARHGRNLRTLARLAGDQTTRDSKRPTPCPATTPTAASKETADEPGFPRMNADKANRGRSRSHDRSALVPSDLRSSAVKRPFAVATNPRFEPLAPPACRSLGEGACPATRRRRAAG